MKLSAPAARRVRPAVRRSRSCRGRTDDGHNRLRLHFSKSSETDLVTVVVGDFQRSPENNYLIGATWGHDLSDTLFGLPIPMTWHLGVQWFNEQGYQQDALGRDGLRQGELPDARAVDPEAHRPRPRRRPELRRSHPVERAAGFRQEGPDVHSEK